MKVKTFSALTDTGLDKKVNDFLDNAYIEVQQIKFSATIFSYNAMVIYKQK